jgi:hypothetical protein
MLLSLLILELSYIILPNEQIKGNWISNCIFYFDRKIMIYVDEDVDFKTTIALF